MDPGSSANPVSHLSLSLTNPLLHPHSALYHLDLPSQDVSPSTVFNSPNVPSTLTYSQMDPSTPSTSHSRYQNTCIPSVVPPGVDPTSVDFRTFFPYIPNEVKHRKRTSRAQLRVLEDVFRKDTKPNAALRKKLAAELDMVPRAVQVWFQNRRAKDKQLRKRALLAPDQENPSASSQTPESPSPKDTPQNESSSSSAATEKLVDPMEEPVSPVTPDPSSAESESAPKNSCSRPCLPDSSAPSSGWQGSPGTPADGMLPHHATAHDYRSQDVDLYNLRRGSLPTVMPSLPQPDVETVHLPPHFDDRRKSLDINCYRLMHHPFAHVAREKNEALLAKSPLSPPGSTQAITRPPPGVGAVAMGAIRSAAHVTHSHPYAHSRPDIFHRASEPHVLFPSRNATLPAVPASGRLPPSVSSSSSAMPHVSRRYDNNRLYTLSMRTISSPIPGPLPTPNFQFGDPSLSPNASPIPGEVDTPPSSSSSPSAQVTSPDISSLQRWAFPRGSTTSLTSATSASSGLSGGLRDGECDTEDAASATTSNFSGLSRFGSVASITGSDSSAMFSDVGSCNAAEMNYDGGMRRGSCGSGYFLEMRMNGLNVNGQRVGASTGPTPVSSGYTSPTSTLSPNDSPQTQGPTSESGPAPSRGESMHKFGRVPSNEVIAARRGSIPPCVATPAPIAPPNPHFPHGSGVYISSEGEEAKYPVQVWSADPSGYASQPQQSQHQHFSHDTNTFLSTSTPTSEPHPHCHPQHSMSHPHQYRSYTHSPTESYPEGGSTPYTVSESVSIPTPPEASAMAMHGMASRGYVVGMSIPPHSTPAHVAEYQNGDAYHGQEGWGVQ